MRCCPIKGSFYHSPAQLHASANRFALSDCDCCITLYPNYFHWSQSFYPREPEQSRQLLFHTLTSESAVVWTGWSPTWEVRWGVVEGLSQSWWEVRVLVFAECSQSCWIVFLTISVLQSDCRLDYILHSSMGGHSLRLTGWQENLGAGYSSPAQYWHGLTELSAQVWRTPDLRPRMRSEQWVNWDNLLLTLA